MDYTNFQKEFHNNNIHLYQMDCMELIKQTPDKFYDLAIVDPPYGINVTRMGFIKENNRAIKQKNGNNLRVKKLKYKNGNWDKIKPSTEYWNHLFRVSKHQIIWGIKNFDLPGLGKGLITWNKCVPAGVSFKNYEHAYCSLIDKEIVFTFMWAGMCQGKSLLEPSIQQGNKQLNEKRIHPTQKPVKLYHWLLNNYAQEGDKILDTHLGSGSIAIAAHYAGFELTGCELDNYYFDAMKKRFLECTEQLRIIF